MHVGLAAIGEPVLNVPATAATPISHHDTSARSLGPETRTAPWHLMGDETRPPYFCGTATYEVSRSAAWQRAITARCACAKLTASHRRSAPGFRAAGHLRSGAAWNGRGRRTAGNLRAGTTRD